MAISNDNKFLSLTGLNLLWEKINNKFATKAVATTSADGLMSKTDKANLDELVNLKPAEKGAQVNVIEGVAIAAVGVKSVSLHAVTPVNLLVPSGFVVIVPCTNCNFPLATSPAVETGNISVGT